MDYNREDPRSYIDQLAEDIFYTAEPDSDGLGWFEDADLYRMYAVLALAKGESVTDEDVHNAWAAWASAHQPKHPSLVPFGNLPKHVQRLDEPYKSAIRAIARKRVTESEV